MVWIRLGLGEGSRSRRQRPYGSLPPALDPRSLSDNRAGPCPLAWTQLRAPARPIGRNSAPAPPAQLQSPLPPGGSASPGHAFLAKTGPSGSPGRRQSFWLPKRGFLGLRVEIILPADSSKASGSNTATPFQLPRPPPSISPLSSLIFLIKCPRSIRRGFKTAGKLPVFTETRGVCFPLTVVSRYWSLANSVLHSSSPHPLQTSIRLWAK